ncbi:MAG: DMT family transporter [Bacteroidia bacterium]
MAQSRFFPYLLYLYLILAWGSSFILIKQGLASFSPFQVAALRIVIAGLVMLPFTIGRSKEISRIEWRFILLVGLIGNAIPALLFPYAETVLNSATAGILNTLSPLFVLLIGVFFFQLKPSISQRTGMLIGFSGALVLVLGSGQEIDFWSNALYSLLVVIATIGYGLSTNIMKRYLNTTPSLLATGYALMAMAIPYTIYLLFFSGVGEVFRSAEPSVWMSFGSIAILAALGTALALVCFYRLVQITDPIFSSSVTYVIPIVAMMWGLLDGEKIYPAQYVGMALILSGVFLTNRKKTKST